MDKKKTLADEHEKPAPVAAQEKQPVPDKKDGPQTAPGAPTLQRELGNARVGRMLAAQQPSEKAADEILTG